MLVVKCNVLDNFPFSTTILPLNSNSAFVHVGCWVINPIRRDLHVDNTEFRPFHSKFLIYVESNVVSFVGFMMFLSNHISI